jgi:hypothetical protein
MDEYVAIENHFFLFSFLHFMHTQKEKFDLMRLRIATRRETQLCYTPGCKNLAIRSHIHQAEGPLRLIANNGKVVEVQATIGLDKLKFRFRSVGIKDRKGDVLTFWGMCPQCDASIFRPIETTGYNCLNYRNQLLHAYRGLLNELYKMDYNLKWYERIFSSSEISTGTKKRFQHKKMSQYISSRFLRYFKELIEKDLAHNLELFQFVTIKLPRIEVCTSAIFNKPLHLSITEELLERLKLTPLFKPPQGLTSVTIIPFEDHTICLLGQPLDDELPSNLDLKQIAKLSLEKKLKLISSILIKYIETWCVSTKLFRTWADLKLNNQVLQEMHKYAPAHMKLKPVKFNLFKGYR